MTDSTSYCKGCRRKNIPIEDFYSEFRKRTVHTCKKCRRSVLDSVYKSRPPSIKRIFESIIRDYPDILNSKDPTVRFALEKYGGS